MSTFNTVPDDSYVPEEKEENNGFETIIMIDNEDCSSEIPVTLTLIPCGQRDYMLAHFDIINIDLLDVAVEQWESETGNKIINDY